MDSTFLWLINIHAVIEYYNMVIATLEILDIKRKIVFAHTISIHAVPYLMNVYASVLTLVNFYIHLVRVTQNRPLSPTKGYEVQPF